MEVIIGVKCAGWGQPEFTKIEIPDSATEDEREEALRTAAIDTSGFEFWIESKQ